MSRLRVLLVSTDAGESDRISQRLGTAGHSVLAVETMGDASEALGLQRFDAVLVSESTDADDLAAFASGVRQLEKAGRGEVRTPLIVYSIRVTELKLAVGNGETGSADALIPNDSDPALFGEIVEQVRRHYSQTAGASGARDSEEMAVFDREGFSELLGHNGELLDEIIGLFLDESRSQMGEMENCMRTPDFVSLGKVAHTLKGSLGTLHAHRARSRAQALEVAAARQMEAEAQSHLECLKNELDELQPLLIRMRSEL